MKITLTIQNKGVVYEFRAKNIHTLLDRIKTILGLNEGTLASHSTLMHKADKVFLISKNRFGTYYGKNGSFHP